jgi:drug/metabolite transporter (DMT)-like permease
MEMMRIEIPFVPSEPQVLRMLFAMALVPGFIGVSLYYKGLKKVPASAATILELTFPVCALAVNQYFLHFHLLTIQWIAAFALLLSMIGVSQAATASLPMRLLRRPKS